MSQRATTMNHAFLQCLRLPLASAVGFSLLSLPLVMPQAQALPNGRVSFNSLAAGVASASQGDCRLGLLNGVAAVGPQAQLLHAACTVAYGAGG